MSDILAESRDIVSEQIDLSGVWQVWLQPHRPEGNRHSGDCFLPGSLDQAGLGDENVETGWLGGLSRKVSYVGTAWYQRKVEVPRAWVGRQIELVLERVHWFSELWINEDYVGERESLSAPHRYCFVAESTELIVELAIDNSIRVPIGRIGHAVTDWTQTNWNGAIGELVLQLAQTEPAQLVVSSTTDSVSCSGVCEPNTIIETRARVGILSQHCSAHSDKHGRFEVEIKLQDAPRWSDPSFETGLLEVSGPNWSVERAFGLRKLGTQGKQLQLNGTPIFLRGTLECCVFPKTGFPPCDAESWLYAIGRAKEFGLNHVRFHSWCPPEAAFVAADRLGVLLQVELPLWTGTWAITSDRRLLEFCKREAHRIMLEYGHHPSFVMFTLGNEMSFYGDEPEVSEFLRELKQTYPDKLFNFSSHGTWLGPECDYYVQADNGKPGAENLPLRGSTWFGVGSRFDREAPATTATCNEAASQFDRPVISHEVGEWAMYPDVHRADTYDGVLEARNFRAIAKGLEKHGMLDQAPDFVRASGKLSFQLYKEEIETLLRTEGLAGYQLLGLTDFPGQGTATIGILDAFWESKGFVEAAEFRQFCAPTVPLLELDKRVFLRSESLRAAASVRSDATMENCELRWRVLDATGVQVVHGSLGVRDLLAGCATRFDPLDLPLDSLSAPSRYTVELSLGEARNSWSVWVLPEIFPEVPLHETLVTSSYSEDVRRSLRSGQAVWLRMNPRTSWGGVPGRFAPAFWSPIHFQEQVGTMGTLIQNEHPLFSHFPTEEHTDWQWWDILTSSKSRVLNDLPGEFRPIVQVIDRYERNDKLGCVFEAAVGDGRLLVSCIDFDDTATRPAARQLEYSIRRYLASDQFRPQQAVDLRQMDLVFRLDP